MFMHNRVTACSAVHQELHHARTTSKRPSPTIVTKAMLSKHNIHIRRQLFDLGLAPQRVKHLAGKVHAEGKQGREANPMVREKVEDGQRGDVHPHIVRNRTWDGVDVRVERVGRDRRS